MRRALGHIIYALLAIVLGSIWFGVLLAGTIVVLLLAITPLGAPALVFYSTVMRGAARIEIATLSALTGSRIPLNQPTNERATWGRALGVLRDAPFWSQQLYLVLRTALGWPIAVTILSTLGAGVALIVSPLMPGSFDDAEGAFDLGPWHGTIADNPGISMLAGGIAIIVALAVSLLVGYVFGHVARRLLHQRPTPTSAIASPPAEPVVEQWAMPGGTRAVLALHAITSLAVSALLVTIWALVDASIFWPVWPILALAMIFGWHASWFVAGRWQTSTGAPRTESDPLVLHAGIAISIELFLVGIAIAAGTGIGWTVWPGLALLVTIGMHVLIQRALGTFAPLEERIDSLTSTRSGVVDVQETEIRRIERDLHDGAQARIVALGMTLGMAEQKLDTDPEAARTLLAEARIGASEALVELRSLARGILPPVLADRGLGAAIESLVALTPMPITISVNVPARPAPAIERAAYFVVAESITNAVKHAGATEIVIEARCASDVLHIEVRDDGCGGADSRGSGLTGLRQRVDAFDGTLTVTSPTGGPTTIVAEIPCAS